VPLPTALSLILREHLTGEPVPEAAERGVSMVRNWIEKKAGKDFEALAEKLGDQKAFQHLALDMLGHLELTRAELEPNGEDEENPDRATSPMRTISPARIRRRCLSRWRRPPNPRAATMRAGRRRWRNVR
jgi:cobalamin biosynthesis protein CobT